ncbi:MAG: glycosyltransferase family 2 protein [Deltaproteobacteria bacterium]
MGTLALELLVFGSLGLVAYAYLGYPLLLVALDALQQAASNVARLRRGLDRRRGREPSEPPYVTLVIAAYNEARVIREKLENCLALDYPPDRLEILVGSDGSTDATDEIVRAFAFRGVTLSCAPRGGKAKVLDRLIPMAKGELVVLSDANTMFRADALRRLVSRMDDPEVGAVCGQLKFVPSLPATAGVGGRGGDAGEREGLYWTYESLLKLYEGKLGCVVGANGGIYAIRRRLFQPLPRGTITDDFVIPLRLLAAGYRVLYEPAAVAYEDAPEAVSTEFGRRVRIGAGNYQSLSLLGALARSPRPFAAAAFVSHKLLRWVTPFLLTFGLAGSLALWSHPLVRVALLLQLAFYAAAVRGGFGGAASPAGKACRLAHYFVSMNLALAVGGWRHLRQTQSAAWDRTPRPAGQ